MLVDNEKNKIIQRKEEELQRQRDIES